MDSPSTIEAKGCPYPDGVLADGGDTPAQANFDLVSRILTWTGAFLLVWACLRDDRTQDVAVAAIPGGILGLLYAIRHLRNAWRPRRTRALSSHLACLLLVVLPGALSSGRPALSWAIAVLVVFAYLCALAVVEAFTRTSTERSSPRKFAILVLACSAAVVIGRFLAAVVRANGAGFPPQWMAPASTNSALGHLPAFLLVGSFPILVAAARVADRPAPKLMWRCGAVLAATGILFSFSRAAWIAFAVEIVMLALESGRLRPRILAVGVAGALLAAWIVPGVGQRAASVASATASTNRQRLDQWAAACNLIAASPVAGHGLGTFRGLWRDSFAGKEGRTYSWPNNLYLHVAAESGLPALFVFLAWVWRGISRLRQATAEPPDGRDSWRPALRRAFSVAIAGFLCYGLFDL